MKKYNIQLYELDKATGKTKLKSLFDIFSQLKANDASIQDLTRLFDKIGGNAANNVFAELMKLPELIQNSVYAAGLSDRIASEKQETIKGKWDKVTSQFTETGMRLTVPLSRKGWIIWSYCYNNLVQPRCSRI